jgi:Domain of unknown function (DUF4915)
VTEFGGYGARMWRGLGSTERVIARRCRGLVVSFCNPPHALVGVHRHDGRGLVQLPLEPAEQFTGIAADQTHLYVATGAHGVARLVALTRTTWTVAWEAPLPRADDVHSIAVTDGYLYAVSTGTDSLIRYRLDRGVSDPEIVWSPTGAVEDTHHLNGIALWSGSIIVSAFGPRLGDRWASARDGYLYDVSRGAPIHKGIYHPHSVLPWRDDLWWCESATGTVHSLSGRRCVVDGYARGLAQLSNRLLAIGTSVGRHTGDGSITNPLDPGVPAGRCGVTVFDARTDTIRGFLDTGGIGPEIYGCWMPRGGA